MILSQIQEIASIDSEIVQLHERLSSLYRQREDICTYKASMKDKSSTSSLQSIDDSINLDDIDLSL